MARVLSPTSVGVAGLVSTGVGETATDFVENGHEEPIDLLRAVGNKSAGEQEAAGWRPA
jgi:hypothetical protein